METIRKLMDADLRSAGTRFTAIISTDSVDRDHEVLMPLGMQADNFRRTGTVLWNHDPGRPIAALVPGSLRATERTVEAQAEFAKRPADWPEEQEWFPDFIAAMVKCGVVKGVSVGFRPLESPRAATKQDRERYGEAVERVYRRWELLEFSPVSVPANQDALITAVSKGLVTQERAGELFGLTQPTEPKPAPAAKHRTTVLIQIPESGPDIGELVKIEVARRRGKLYI